MFHRGRQPDTGVCGTIPCADGKRPYGGVCRASWVCRPSRGAGHLGRHQGAPGVPHSPLPGQLQQWAAWGILSGVLPGCRVCRDLPAPPPLPVPVRAPLRRCQPAGRLTARASHGGMRPCPGCGEPGVPAWHHSCAETLPGRQGGRLAFAGGVQHALRVPSPTQSCGTGSQQHRVQGHVLPGCCSFRFLHPGIRDAGAQDPVVRRAASAQHEDGAQDAVSAGEGLGPEGIRHLLQAGDRPGHPAGAGASRSGHLPPPGRGGQRVGHAARLRGGGDTGPRDRASPHGCRGTGRAGDRGEDRRQPGLGSQQLYCPAGVRRSYQAWTSPSRHNPTIRNGGLSTEPTYPACLDKSKLVLGIDVKCVNTTCDSKVCLVPPGETASPLLYQQSPVSPSGMCPFLVYRERVEQSLNYRSIARVP